MATNDETPSTAPTGGNEPMETVAADVPAKHTADEELGKRYAYHSPSGEAVQRHDTLRSEFLWFARFLNNALPEGRSKALAHTALEEASMHAHASIAREPSLHDQAAPCLHNQAAP